MSKILTEEKVLKKLNIPDFRHLTKDKVITMASMLDKMDPEVAKKAIEQFPDFSLTAKDMLGDYKQELIKVIESSDESVKSYYNNCNMIIESLQKELEKENLTFDERKYIIEQMLYISDNIKEKDTEHKKFLTILATVAGATIVGVVAVLASTLGGNTKIDLKDINSDL